MCSRATKRIASMRSTTSTATFSQRDAVSSASDDEVEAPGRLRGDGQQLGIVRCLGEPSAASRSAENVEPLLQVPDGTAAGDRRHLVVAIGALGVAGERRVIEHRRRAHGLEAALVESAPLATEQLVHDGVGDEGVGEPELVVADLDHDASADERRGGRRASSSSAASVTVSSDSNDADRPYTASASTTQRRP